MAPNNSTSNICLSYYLPISVSQPKNLSPLISLKLSLNLPSVSSSLTLSDSLPVHLLVFLCISSFSISFTFSPSFSFLVFPVSLPPFPYLPVSGSLASVPFPAQTTSGQSIILGMGGAGGPPGKEQRGNSMGEEFELLQIWA